MVPEVLNLTDPPGASDSGSRPGPDAGGGEALIRRRGYVISIIFSRTA
jgi:hypothetical protein